MFATNDPAKLNRRDFLEMGAVTLGCMPGGVNLREGIADSPGEEFRTALCDLLGIRYPILQAGMGSGVASPALVAAVSNAGGLGILTGTLVPPDELRQQIRQIRKLTDKPFGVNLILHSKLLPPIDAKTLPENVVQAAQDIFNRFRERLGLAKTTARPQTAPDLLNAAFEVILEERVPVWSIGLGNPTPEMVGRCRERGVKVVAMVATVDDARAVAASGVDAIVAQGSEAGGHRSTWVKRESREAASVGGMALIPQVAGAVRVPVIAAGGITDGRGMLAALALGAAGVLIGTRFLLTKESGAPDFYKKALLASNSDATTVTDVFTGMYARVVRNAFTEEYAASGAPVLPPFLQFLAAADINKAAAEKGNGDYYPLYAGQGVGGMRDLPAAADVVQGIIREARATLAELPQRIRLS